MNIFITGVSSGIGHALATKYLAAGHNVWGVSRREPADLAAQKNFAFASVDLRDHAATTAALSNFLAPVEAFDLAILNAGILSPFADMSEAKLDDLRESMEINVWANKTVLDVLFADGRTIDQVIAISSGAAVNGNRGWNGYSVSKAALNMLTMLYAREQPETHFTALAPGIIDTAMQATIAAEPHDERFPALASLRQRRGTPAMPGPHDAADDLIAAIERLPDLVESGSFADIRKPPLA